jgi:hypothetical protein
MEPVNTLRNINGDASLDNVPQPTTEGFFSKPVDPLRTLPLTQEEAPDSAPADMAPEPIADLGETEEAVPKVETEQDLPGVGGTAITTHVGENYKG